MPGRFSEHLRLAAWLQVGQGSSGDLSFLFCIGREAGKKCWRFRARVRVGKSQADFPSFCNPQTCCNWDAQKGEYVYPAKKHLQQYRVLITTLITASR